MVALKLAMSSHFPLPKFFSPSGFVSPLSNGMSRATSDRKPKTNDQILPSPIFLPIEKMNQMGLVRITSWYPIFNGSHFGLPPSEIDRMTGLPPKIV